MPSPAYAGGISGRVMIATGGMAELFASDRATIERHAGRRTGSTLRVHEVLKARPILSLSGISDYTMLSFPTAATAMQLLLDQGIVRELTGKSRNRLFVIRWVSFYPERGD